MTVFIHEKILYNRIEIYDSNIFGGQKTNMNIRLDRNKLNIGAYWLQPYAGSEKHVHDIAECNIDFVLCVHEAMRDTLDYFKTYGVGAAVLAAAPGWHFGHYGEMAKLNPLCSYSEAAEKFIDHPAILAIDAVDEPNAVDFPHMGKVVDCINERFPNQFAFVNLLPNYALKISDERRDIESMLGTRTYKEYIDLYCKYVNTDYICYDFYMYPPSRDSVVGWFYDNFKVVGDACRKSCRSLWVVMQINAADPTVFLSENYIRFQANAALAFGAETIIWACYTAGWWNNNALDENGNKTPQYEKIRKVNSELKKIGVPYMKYKNIATHCVGFDGTVFLEESEKNSIDSFDNMHFSGVREETGGPILVGEMDSRGGSGSAALMICAADDPFDRAGRENTVVFSVRKGNTIRAFNGDGQIVPYHSDDGSFRINIASGHGVLITVDD